VRKLRGGRFRRGEIVAVQLPAYRGEELKDVSVKDEVRVAAKRFFQPWW